MAYTIRNITINSEICPIGMDVKNPLIAWKYETDAPLTQKQMRICVSAEADGLRREAG